MKKNHLMFLESKKVRLKVILDDLTSQIRVEKKRVREEKRVSKVQFETELRRPFMMQVAKEKTLRQYIQVMRVVVANELRVRGATRKEVDKILGVCYVRILESAYDLLSSQKRMDVDFKTKIEELGKELKGDTINEQLENSFSE